MKIAHIAISLLATVAWHSLAQQTNATITTDTSCAVVLPSFNQEQLMPTGEYRVIADSASVSSNRDATFTGRVALFSDSAIIQAQSALFEQGGKQVSASGEVLYRDAIMQITSDSLQIDSINKQLTLDQTEYLLTDVMARGAAEHIRLSEQSGVSLSDVSFTTCPLDNRDWQIQASEIKLSQDSNWGEARNTRFYIADVPVFYLPYFAFPVSNQRQSGLLFPEITSSSPTGVDITQPFYWNLAPNYDLTLSPRMMTRRGIQLGTEFRYLTQHNSGDLYLEYLPTDMDLPDGDHRYLYRWRHVGLISENWLANVDFNGISDDNYIVDFGSRFFNRADAYLNRSASVQYFSDNLRATARIRDFDVLGGLQDSYRVLPEITLDYRQQLAEYVEFNLSSELSYFDNSNDALPTALRWHLAPSITLPYRKAWGEMLLESTLFNTYYRQSGTENTSLDTSVNRTIPQARLFARLFLERNDLSLGLSRKILLEPTFQYLYTGFRDQNNIGIYDSAALLVDVEGLFRGREFSGLDRINDNNQMTLAMTTRVFDENDKEQFVLSVGQIFYFEQSRLVATANDVNRSALAAELDWRFADKWLLNTDFQLTTDNDKVQRSSIMLEYRQSRERLVQLTHRYVRDLSGETIEQVGVSANWPIRKNWQWVARNVRDMSRQRSLESFIGLQYESCCWSARLIAQRQISNRLVFGGTQVTDEYDSGVAFQFIFKGMGSERSRRNMLEDGMFGYRQPYSLQ